MTQTVIEPRSPGPLVNTLSLRAIRQCGKKYQKNKVIQGEEFNKKVDVITFRFQSTIIRTQKRCYKESLDHRWMLKHFWSLIMPFSSEHRNIKLLSVLWPNSKVRYKQKTFCSLKMIISKYVGTTQNSLFNEESCFLLKYWNVINLSFFNYGLNSITAVLLKGWLRH